MSVDARIRKGLTMIENKLPPVDTAEGFETLQRDVRRDTRRRRVLVGAAAAAVLVAGTTAVVVGRTGNDQVEPAPTPPKTTMFESQVYEYSVPLPNGWVTGAATLPADAPKVTGEPVEDSFRPTGTDTTIKVVAFDLGRQTYAAWAKAYHQSVLEDRHTPSGCDGGDPATWPSTPVGHTEGHLLQRCNFAEVIVPVGVRVYDFIWSNQGFELGKHYPQDKFERLLVDVRLPDAATAREPLWTAPPSHGS